MKSNLLSVAALACLLTTLPIDSANAAATGGGGALFASGTNFLTALETLLTGTWARIIAIIAVVCLGFAWMSGRISWAIAGSTIGGVILVFGSAAIVDSVSGAI